MTFAWAAGIAAVGTVGGALIGSSAASGAAKSQAAASAAATAAQQRQYNTTRDDQAPYRAAGNAALDQYNKLMGITPSRSGSTVDQVTQAYRDVLGRDPDAGGLDAYRQHMNDGASIDQVRAWLAASPEGTSPHGTWTDPNGAAQGTSGAAQDAEYGSYAKPLTAAEVQMDPGYEFGRAQGQQGIDRISAAAGGRLSGAALKAASQYNTDYATTGYSTAYNRANQARSDRLNRLAALAGIGQTATQQTGAAGQANANAIGNIATAQGNAAGAAQIAQGNIWSGAGNQIASLYGRNSGSNPSYGGGNTGIDASTNLPNYALVS